MPFNCKKIVIVILGMSFYSSLSATDKDAFPSGADLLRSCESMLSSEATQMQHMLCTWYILPCDCEQKDDSIPRVCLPSKINEIELAKTIVNDLNLNHDLQKKSSQFAASTILQKYYPCEAGN